MTVATPAPPWPAILFSRAPVRAGLFRVNPEHREVHLLFGAANLVRSRLQMGVVLYAFGIP